MGCATPGSLVHRVDSTGPPAAPARAQPDALEPAPDYDLADLLYER